MKGIIAVALLGAMACTDALASPVTFSFSAQTDGNQYAFQLAEDGTYTDTTQYDVGALDLDESFTFDWAVQGFDSRAIDYGHQVYHEANTIFTAPAMTVAGGLLSSGLRPSFIPGTEYVVPNLAATLSLLLPTGAEAGLGSTRFELGVFWTAMQFDALGALHLFSYARSYSFSNSNLVSSLDDLVAFNDEMFQQLLLHPDTQRSFQESVTETTSGCRQPELCGNNGTWAYSVSGTFDFAQLNAVPEPETVALMGLGLLLLGNRIGRKKTTC